MLEGYVGAEGIVLHIWAKGEAAPVEYTVKGELAGEDGLAEILEEEMVKGIRNEVSSNRAALIEDSEYERALERARQTRRQLQGEETKQKVDFVIAFIENVRADGKQGEEAGQTALRIYRRVLEQTNDEAERMRTQTNLAIAEFRVAKQEKDLQRAELAVSYWKEAENLAEKIGLIDAWATTRSWQTEGDLFIYASTGNSTRLARALKRQVETVEDTQGLIVDDVLFRVVTFLHRASREWGKKHSQRRCDGPPTRLIAFRDIIGEEMCETVHLIDWTDADYVRRLERIQRWTDLARELGHQTALAGLAGVRANLWRAQGIERKDPGLLITAFEDTQETRIWKRLIDEGLSDGPFEIGIPGMVAFVDIEVTLALACGDRLYIARLRKQIERAGLWCDRVSPEECKHRKEWRAQLVGALEYGLTEDKEGNTERKEYAMESEKPSSKVWEQAEWFRNQVRLPIPNGSYCPNRPPGIGEPRTVRRNEVIENRVMDLRKMEGTGQCSLSKREWSRAPSIYEYSDREKWHVDAWSWITKNDARMNRDVQTILECAGYL